MRVLLKRSPPTHQRHQRQKLLPPRMLPPPILHIRMSNHILRSHKLHSGALDRDHRGALLRRASLQLWLREAADRVMVPFQERHAFKRETHSARPIGGRWDAALERMPERGHPRIEERGAFFLEHLLDKVGCEDGRGRLVSRKK